MSSNIVFSTAIGGKTLSRQAEYLVQSIHRHYPEAEIFAFVTEDEYNEIPGDRLNRIKNFASIIIGEMPIQDYPISTKVGAMKYASVNSSYQYLVSLDADIIIVGKFERYLSETEECDVHMKPVDATGHYWGKKESSDSWSYVASRLGFEDPVPKVETTVDNEIIKPYYNAGVVIAEHDQFVQDWYQTTFEVYNTIRNNTYSHYSDQVALGLLSQIYDVGELTDLENYPLPHYSSYPNDIIALHHHGFENISTIDDNELITQLTEIGLWDEISKPPNPKYYVKKIKSKAKNFVNTRGFLPI